MNGLDEPGEDGSRVGWTELLSIPASHRATDLGRALLADSLRGFHAAGATSAAVMVDLLDPGQDEATFTSLGYRIASATLEYVAGPFPAGVAAQLREGHITPG